MKKRGNVIRGIALLAFIVLMNVQPINFFFRVVIGDKSIKFPDYHFSGGVANGFSSWLHNDEASALEEKFDYYRQFYPNDSVLYRNFSIKFWKFWRWREYVSSPLYDYPYKKIPYEWMIQESGVELDSLGKPLK